jgi:hypothetical protein
MKILRSIVHGAEGCAGSQSFAAEAMIALQDPRQAGPSQGTGMPVREFVEDNRAENAAC